MEIAWWLEQQPEVSQVRYIGLESHPQHKLALRQMTGFGSMISFELEGGMEAGRILMGSMSAWRLWRCRSEAWKVSSNIPPP